MKKRNIKDYSNDELLSWKKDSTENVLIVELIDEIIRLREYEWKYKELEK